MKKYFVRKFTALLLVFTVLLNIFTSSALAAPKKNENSVEISDYIEDLTSYVQRNKDGTLELSKKAVKLVGSDVYYSAISSMQNVNRMIEEGYLSTDKDCNISITSKYIEEISNQCNSDQFVVANNNELSIINVESALKDMQKASASGGVTKIVWTWYGCELYLNDDLCNDVVGGTSIATLLGLVIPDPVVCKAIAIACALSGGLISINNNGNGVRIKMYIIYLPLPPKITPFWFAPQ